MTCGLLASCNEDDNTGESVINYTPVVVTLSTLDNNAMLDETAIDADTGYSITVTATIDSPQVTDITIPLTKIGGTATGEDYSINGSITIIAASTSASTTVVINKTGNTEGDETLSIGAISDDLIANVSMVNPFSLDVTIQNDYVDYNAYLAVTWEGFVFPEEDPAVSDVDLCDIDFDIYVIDLSGNYYIGYDGATGSCTEEGAFDVSAMADGVYAVAYQVYDNPLFGSTVAELDVDFPVTATLSQGYEGEFFASQDLVIDYNTVNTAPNGEPGTPVIIFTVTGGVVSDMMAL